MSIIRRRGAGGFQLSGSLTLGVALLVSLVTGCAPEGGPELGVEEDESTFSAVPLPDPGIPGYTFPEPESTVVAWPKHPPDSAAINLHAWGLWTALTSKTNETFRGDTLRVFETWFTPGDIKVRKSQGVSVQDFRRHPRPLELPRQLVPPDLAESTVVGFVKYDPSATQYAEWNNLFSASALDSLRLASAAIRFPNTAVTLKPVFLPGFVDPLELIESRYYRLPIWPGPPDSVQTWGFNKWSRCVWVDTQDQTDGPGTGAVDTNCDASGAAPTDSTTTYGLGRFIHFVEQDTTRILVAMHVTSREMTRWTWQTFWWTPTPDEPHSPSSRSIAAHRPSQLQGAPRNYAVCTAYSMVNPPQPNTSGSNTGNSVYCYNPWLEAGFGPRDLPDSSPGMYNGMPVNNNFGIQTNCMSCHAQARWPAQHDTAGNRCSYTGDRYIDLDGAQFIGTLKLDFAWSIEGNVVPPDTTQIIPRCPSR